MVNSPAHYRIYPETEAIHIIQAVLTDEQFRGFLMGNSLKYRLRAGEKGPPDQCIAKAQWYEHLLRGLPEAGK